MVSTRRVLGAVSVTTPSLCDTAAVVEVAARRHATSFSASISPATNAIHGLERPGLAALVEAPWHERGDGQPMGSWAPRIWTSRGGGPAYAAAPISPFVIALGASSTPKSRMVMFDRFGWLATPAARSDAANARKASWSLNM